MYLLDKIVEYGRKWLVEPLTSVFTGSRLTWKKRSSPCSDDSLNSRKKIKTVDVASMTSDQLPEVGAIQEENAEEAQGKSSNCGHFNFYFNYNLNFRDRHFSVLSSR